MTHSTKQLSSIIFLLSFIGVSISVYAVAHFYGAVSGSWCNISAVLNCDLVNKSAYAKLGGIPVSLIGLIGYLFLATGAFLKYREQNIDRGLTHFLLIASILGFLFSLYLTGIEAFILHTFCFTCLISQFTILLIAIFSACLYVRKSYF